MVNRTAGRASTHLVLALLALLLIVTTVPAARAQGQIAGSFALGPCPIPAPAGYALDCGTLTVAESRRAPTGKTIQLAVAIVRSPGPTTRPDPVLFLAGGPGQSALLLIADRIPSFSTILETRDLIFIDQRGTGYSRPALNCGPQPASTAGVTLASGAPQESRPASLQAEVDALLACGARYRAQGVALEAYNSVESAADLEDLRMALGYPAWNLFGGSYGTRLALTAMHYRPASIRSAVLNSVIPPQTSFHTGVFATFPAALARLDAACSADPACAAAYPDLEAAFARVVERLNAEAAVLPIHNLETGALIAYLPFSGVDLTTLLFQAMYVTPLLAGLPALIGEADQGNYAPLAQLTSAVIASQAPGAVPPLAQAMAIAVQCNEDVTFSSAEAFVVARDRHRAAAGLAFMPYFNEALLEVCTAWGLGTPVRAANQAARSAVPALLISGELDPITPPAYAREAARTLSRATQVVVPGSGHVPGLLSPCVRGAIARFLDAPALPPDLACLAEERPAPFLVLP